ncbi:MAG TPA: sulfotransferase [Rhodanobacteraceae bacterium]|nr:sulfotransferase [Rhodanobacteraceae bacterium]
MEQHAAREWLAIAQAHLARGDLAAARTTLAQALSEHPAERDLQRAHAGVLQRSGRSSEAESQLRGLLDADPADAASAFTLTGMLQEQGRTSAAATILRACFEPSSNRRDADLAIRAIELLDDCDRKADAAAIAAMAIETNPDDARLHAYAGMLQIQLGEFERARQHYLFALQHDERAWEWHVPIGLASAQRYGSREHPDLTLMRTGLQREGLSDKARAELHFAIGKAHDDLGDYPEAAQHFREGNAIAHRLTKWSRKSWRRAAEARLALPAGTQHADPAPDFAPVFIVGMPRSGTTLLAELLSRHPKVCHRGELPWVAKLAGFPSLAADPARADLLHAAATYAAHSRQDDAGDARWFIDKQPLNFRYVDLMLAMFPNARIIHCRRRSRDTALSLWMQCFLEDVQGYSYDFDDIAIVMRDCERLMTHWRQRFPDAIRSVQYEPLVANPAGVIQGLANWIGLRPLETGTPSPPSQPASSISSASLWQARQPVNTRSVGRWRHYASLVPALSRFPAD